VGECPFWFELVLVALITWRVAVLLVMDDGPFFVIRKVRAALWRDGLPTPLFGEVLQCVGCTSFYTAPVAYGIVEWAPEVVVLSLAAWSAATLAQKLTQ
jgi:hypothetical protein